MKSNRTIAHGLLFFIVLGCVPFVRAQKAEQPASLSQLEASLKRDPDNPKLLIALGLACWDRNDYPHVSYREPKVLYRNLRNGRFEDVSSKMGAALRAENVARGCAFGDFDNDGDVDVIINNLDGPPTLLRNDGGNKNNWIMIKCIGTKSNRSAIGTRVKVKCGDHSQIDEVMSGSSYYSQNDFRLHFGLGSAAKVDRVDLTWPSGVKETFPNLPVNRLIVVQETKGILEQRKFR